MGGNPTLLLANKFSLFLFCLYILMDWRTLHRDHDDNICAILAYILVSLVERGARMRGGVVVVVKGEGERNPCPRPTQNATASLAPLPGGDQKLKHILRQLTPSSYELASVGDNRQSSVIVLEYSGLQGLTTPFVVVCRGCSLQAASI